MKPEPVHCRLHGNTQNRLLRTGHSHVGEVTRVSVQNRFVRRLHVGVRPFLSDKYDITRHPNFKYTADADKRNTFDIEAFLSARLKLKPDEVCDVYEVDTEGV